MSGWVTCILYSTPAEVEGGKKSSISCSSVRVRTGWKREEKGGCGISKSLHFFLPASLPPPSLLFVLSTKDGWWSLLLFCQPASPIQYVGDGRGGEWLFLLFFPFFFLAMTALRRIAHAKHTSFFSNPTRLHIGIFQNFLKR